MLTTGSRRVAHRVVATCTTGLWRPLMALPDGTEIQIFWPAPADSDEITRATAYRVCRLGDTVAEGRTLADVVHLVRRCCSSGTEAFPNARIRG